MVPYTMLCRFNLYPDVNVAHRIVVGQDAPESYNLQDADRLRISHGELSGAISKSLRNFAA
jgi:hypothetical protein